MDAASHSTTRPRTGASHLIRPWEYRHLRAVAGARIAGGVVQIGLGVITLSFGGHNRKTYGWTAFWLLMGVLNLAGGAWEMTVARSAPPELSRSAGTAAGRS